MKYIICALKCEASPIIQSFQLKKIARSLYGSLDTQLIISGMGPEKTTSSLKDLKSLFTKHPPEFCINVGVCGALSHIPIGTALPIRFSQNQSHQRVIASFMSSENEATGILTCRKPLTSPEPLNHACPLVDMESFEVFNFFQINYSECKFGALKIVSDHLSNFRFDKEFFSSLVNSHIETIHTIFEPSF